ncbi:MAG: hypothetical protein HYR90_03660 [Candidatus Andersenbacteria bacterium]|nr:hypothetical protein [Candidatus Andersenbacteria bacterium]MBI3250361.1 hypothetical protein [Candidatus Andersenbacteria bacterium]
MKNKEPAIVGLTNKENKPYNFSRFLRRNWWFLLLAFSKILNQSERDGASGSTFLDVIVLGGIIFALMAAYWFVRYGRHISSQPESAPKPDQANTGSPKKIGAVIIQFYGEDKASVEYMSEAMANASRESDLVQMFTLYYAKMLFNLGRGEPADALVKHITTAGVSVFNDGSPKRANVLSSGQELVKSGFGSVTKTYAGELYEKSDGTRVIQTQMDTVGEGYYAPVSTVMFFQYLAKSLSDTALLFLVTSIAGMTKYYREVGDYSKLQSIFEAPKYGVDTAIRILTK